MQLLPEWLAFEAQLGFRPKISGSPKEIREGYQTLCDTLASQEKTSPSPDLDVRDEIIFGNLRVRIYTPTLEAAKGKLRIGVYAHGGGFVAGSVDAFFEDRNCRYIAEHAPCIIVAVDFRLAPEYLVPTQLFDYMGGFNWAWDHAEELGGSKMECFAIGASVGGGLAISLALKLIEHNLRERIAGVVALAPSVVHPDFVPEKFKPMFKAYEENAEGPLIDREAMYVFYGHCGATDQSRNRDVFPALHERLAELPPTYISTCGADPVRDDGYIIKQELDKAGIRNKIKNYEALPHFFWIYPQLMAGDEFRADSAAAVNFVLSKGIEQ